MTPKESGYWFPAEWEPHKATWLSYPHNEASWPGKIHTIFPYYHEFVKAISSAEEVHINVNDEEMKKRVEDALAGAGAKMENVFLHIHPTNDAWCRDHGPAFVINPNADKKKAVVNWGYNGWGNKYPHDLDDNIPLQVAHLLGLPVFSPGIVMEGGSIDVNGKGLLITTTSCLLNENRNPHLTKAGIEKYLREYYGVDEVFWLGDGIAGDDTDGHVDDISRFVAPDVIVTMIEPDPSDENHIPLKENLKTLKKLVLPDGKKPAIVEIPMPEPLYYEGQRLPASYANFYICNAGVIVPTFRCKQDQKAIDLLAQCFPDRPVIGIDSVEIIWGLGSWHCLSQQEPAVG